MPWGLQRQELVAPVKRVMLEAHLQSGANMECIPRGGGKGAACANSTGEGQCESGRRRLQQSEIPVPHRTAAFSGRAGGRRGVRPRAARRTGRSNREIQRQVDVRICGDSVENDTCA